MIEKRAGFVALIRREVQTREFDGALRHLTELQERTPQVRVAPMLLARLALQLTDAQRTGDAAIVAAILDDLDSTFPEAPGAATANAIDAVVQNWGAHPYTLGTYSYPKVGTYTTASDNKRADLQMPVANNRIFFAGEGSHETHPSTVVGALHEGERAANDVHAVNGNPNDPPPLPSGGEFVNAQGFKVKGSHNTDLDWGGFTSGSVTITRNGFEINGSPFGNSGSTTDNIGARGSASYLYQACDTGTGKCVTDTVNF